LGRRTAPPLKGSPYPKAAVKLHKRAVQVKKGDP